jgi:hypothetical protein
MNRWSIRPYLQPQPRGVALVIVLIMLGVIGLTTAVAIRSAVISQKVSASLRFDASAQQSAELALRFCEAEIEKDPVQRLADLAQVDSLPAMPASRLRWPEAAWWRTPQPAIGQAALHTLPAGLGAVGGAPQPECLVERLQLPDSFDKAFVVTARGFSPGYTRDPMTGQTLSGSVVWLQSTLYYN